MFICWAATCWKCHYLFGYGRVGHGTYICAGIKKGDGVGAGGRAGIPHLIEIGAISLQEARQRCPGLAVLPMRTARYRKVGSIIHGILRRFSPGKAAEKASYDDFYVDITAACASDSITPAPQHPPPRCFVVKGDGQRTGQSGVPRCIAFSAGVRF